MKLSDSDRLKAVVKWLTVQTGKRQSEVGEMLGYNNASSFSQVLNGKKKIPREFCTRLASLDPRINIDFLTGASEEMLKDAGNDVQTAPERPRSPRPDKSPVRTSKAPENGIFVPTELVQMISDLSATIKDQQDMIRALVNTWIKTREGGEK